MQEVCSSLDAQLGGGGVGAIKSESSPLLNPQLKMQVNCDKRDSGSSPSAGYWMGGSGPTTESGFINSQPSMAEFLTHIGPESPKMGPQGFPMVVSPSDSGMEGVPEYPWMKEKKTARKNSAAQARCEPTHQDICLATGPYLGQLFGTR